MDFEDLHMEDGIFMTSEKSVYAADIDEINVEWVNNTSKSLTFCESFYLVKNVNNKWRKMRIPYGIGFNDIGYMIEPHSSAEHIFQLHYIYSDLKPGIYRIVTHFFDNTDIPVTSSNAYNVYAEFTLTDDTDGLLEDSGGHFYRTDFGGALVNFPSDLYPPDPSKDYDSGVLVIETAEQVQEMFNETYSQTLSKDSQSWVRDEKFTNLINKYDDEFFESNQLVTFAVSASGGAYYFTFSKAVYANDKLTIEIIQQSHGIGHAAIVSWVALIELEKVPKDTQIEIVVRNRGW